MIAKSGMGDVNGGYNYNALLYSQTLSFWAQYQNVIVIGGGLLLVGYFAFVSGGRKKFKSRRK